MNDVPLVQKNDINSINTSLIAIKKQLKQLTEAVGLIDVPDVPDLSPYVKKTDVVDVVEAGNMNPVTSNAVVPADEVAVGNMHSVASDAVAKSLSYSTTEQKTGGTWIDGKPIYRKTYYADQVNITGSGTAKIGYVGDIPSNVANLIFMQGAFWNGGQIWYCLPNTPYDAVQYGQQLYFGLDGKIAILQAQNNVLYKVQITIEYTKTTD